MMKLLFTSTFLIFGILLSGVAFGQACEELFKDKLEPNSRLINCGGNYTVERLRNRLVVVKVYCPENKYVILRATYKSNNFTELHGLYERRKDDGTILSSGQYHNNLRIGKWITCENEVGNYKRGRRDGTWRTYKQDSILIGVNNFRDGALHGVQKKYNSNGETIMEERYRNGALVSTTLDTSLAVVETLPKFPGCESLNSSEAEAQRCSDIKMLEFLYSNLVYPDEARDKEIQGQAIIRLTIDKEGNVTNIEVLNAITKDIGESLINIFKSMPVWNPGLKNDVPVNVNFTLPVNFRLEGAENLPIFNFSEDCIKS